MLVELLTQELLSRKSNPLYIIMAPFARSDDDDRDTMGIYMDDDDYYFETMGFRMDGIESSLTGVAQQLNDDDDDDDIETGASTTSVHILLDDEHDIAARGLTTTDDDDVHEELETMSPALIELLLHLDNCCVRIAPLAIGCYLVLLLGFWFLS